MLTIYEFSTGIKKPSWDDRSRRWIFHGYDVSQRYGSNSFRLDRSVELGAEGIPEVIDRAIRNDYLDIKPDYNSLAMAGRYLNNEWAVLAVASYLSDGACVYRYFGCRGDLNQGLDPILTLIDWYRRQEPKPHFDPTPNRQLVFEQVASTSRHSTQLHPIQDEVLNALHGEVSGPIPQIYITDLLDLQGIISGLSVDELVGFGWALGVINSEGLATSGKFRLIQSNHNQLWVVRKSTEFVYSGTRVVDTNSLKYALNNLASDSPSNIKNLIQQLFFEDVSELAWKDIFKNIGLEKLVESSSPSHSSIRLLVLQAVLIPKTITTLIEKSLNQENQKTIQEFEYRLLDEMLMDPCHVQSDNILFNGDIVVRDKLLDKLYEGIWICLLPNPKINKYINVKVLISNKGLWHFVLCSRIAIDFYNYFNGKDSLTSQAKEFFDLVNSRGIGTRTIFKHLQLQSLWHDIDPVIAAFACERASETIPMKIYNQIEKAECWKDYIIKLQLRKPRTRLRYI